MATPLQIPNADRNLSLMARTIKASGLETNSMARVLHPAGSGQPCLGKLNATGSYDQAMKPERLIADLDALINLHIPTTKDAPRFPAMARNCEHWVDGISAWWSGTDRFR